MAIVENCENLQLHGILHSSASDEYICEQLTNYNYEICQQDANGATLLHLACKYKRSCVIFELLKLGADINESDNFGRTPLHYATAIKSTEVVLILILNGADINAPDKLGQTALFYASQYKTKFIILLLLHYGADIEHRNNKGDTVLRQMCAAINGDFIEIIKLLIIMNANIVGESNNGKSAYQYATENGLDEIIVLFTAIDKCNPNDIETLFDNIILNLKPISNEKFKWEETFLHIICTNYHCLEKYQNLIKTFRYHTYHYHLHSCFEQIQFISNLSDYITIHKYIIVDSLERNVELAVKYNGNYIFARNTYRIIKLVVRKCRIDINAKNYLGETALNLLNTKNIAFNELAKCEQFLIKNGANKHINDKLNLTRLFFKFTRKNEGTVAFSPQNDSPTVPILQNNLQVYMDYLSYQSANNYDANLFEVCIQIAVQNNWYSIINYFVKNIPFAVDIIFFELCSSLHKSTFINQYFYAIIHDLILYHSVKCHASVIQQLMPKPSDRRYTKVFRKKLFLVMEMFTHCNFNLDYNDELYKDCFINPIYDSSHSIIFTRNIRYTVAMNVSVASVITLCLMKGVHNFKQHLTEICSIPEYGNSKYFLELQALNEKKFNGSTTSVLKFLLANENNTAILVKNKIIVDQLSSTVFRTTYAPLFGDVLNEKLRVALERNSMLKNAAKTIIALMPNELRLPEIPVDIICNYLKKKDLQKLIK